MAWLVKHALERDGQSLDGVEVCRLGCGDRDAADSRAERVDGGIGPRLAARARADDYVTRPFSLRELALRVQALLRRRTRAEQAASATTFRSGRLEVDFETIDVRVDGMPVRPSRVSVQRMTSRVSPT